MNSDFQALLPNGVIVQLEGKPNTSLRQFKALVWSKASLKPLYHLLKDPSHYNVIGINQRSGDEEIYQNESRRIDSLHAAGNMLRFVERSRSSMKDDGAGSPQRTACQEIDACVGISEPDLDLLSTTESEHASECRKSLLDLVDKCTAKLSKAGPKALLAYTDSAEVDASTTNLVNLPADDCWKLDVWIAPKDEDSEALKNQTNYLTTTLSLDRTSTVGQVIGQVLQWRGDSITDEKALAAFCLKVCCCTEYMLDLNKPLLHYTYIQTWLRDNKTPRVLALLCRLCESTFSFEFIRPRSVPRTTETLPSSSMVTPDLQDNKRLSLSTVNDIFSITLISGRNLFAKGGTLFVEIGLVHGVNRVTPMVKTRPIPTSSRPLWSEKVEFPIRVRNLPLAARLTFVLYHTRSPNVGCHKTEVTYPTGWAVYTLFDHRGFFSGGHLNLTVHPCGLNWSEKDMSGGLSGYEIATENEAQLQLELLESNICVSFYDNPSICQLVSDVVAKAKRKSKKDIGDSETSSDQYIQDRIAKICSEDPLSNIPMQDEAFLWRHRRQCLIQPTSLPRLARSFRWNSRKKIQQFYELLNVWPSIPLETSLQLLNSAFIDPKLREFAVEALDKQMTDTRLLDYLVQFTQLLKTEPYLDNILARFVLRRALANGRIAMTLYWHLHGEMQQPGIQLRFGLLLEALIRGCGPVRHRIYKQICAMDKLTCLTSVLQSEKDEVQITLLRERLSSAEMRKAIENFVSPLNSSFMLGQLEVDQCRVMSSKKRPVFLVWTNPDPMGWCHIPYRRILFKQGDDLRQDVLTLKLISLMDRLWRAEGLDLQLIVYRCVVTRLQQGMIEIVENSQTVMDIQRGQLASALQMDTSQLHHWLAASNPESEYGEVIDRFTRSCAGFVVATYVLGIRDRHPDNIMITERGNLFHIDFGHFLDHKKKKFGFVRERVPVVLINDFARTITRGADRPLESPLFTDFIDLCCQAYLILRKRATMVLTLMATMISCGLPELTSMDDLDYLRMTLAVDKTGEEALRIFRAKLYKSYRLGWSTKADWFAHWMHN